MLHSNLMTTLLNSIGDEVLSAEAEHAPLNSHHEAYAVILEELDEFWEHVKLKREKRDILAMRNELIQVAAMCVRAVRDTIDNQSTFTEGPRSQ